MTRARAIGLGLGAGLAMLTAAAIAWVALGRGAPDAAPDRSPREASEPLAPPFLMFRSLAAGDAHGRLAMIALDRPQAPRHLAPLSCMRVAYAEGAGLCLVEEGASPVAHVAYVFDRRFERRHRLVLPGIPVRARVAPGGARAAVTVFAEEESAAGERLVARTLVVDVASGATIDPAGFVIEAATGGPAPAPMDVAGLSFAGDGNRVYATLIADGQWHVAEGSLESRRLTIRWSGLAGEALSPDGARLAAKRPSGPRGGIWQLVLLDLATGAERPLTQGDRSVDDQVEWLDPGHLVYHDAAGATTGIWILDVDRGGPPRLLVGEAFSPSVGR